MTQEVINSISVICFDRFLIIGCVGCQIGIFQLVTRIIVSRPHSTVDTSAPIILRPGFGSQAQHLFSWSDIDEIPTIIVIGL